MLDDDKPPQQIVSEKGLETGVGLRQHRSGDRSSARSQHKQVEQYRAGNDKVFGFIVGQIMKATQGKANPQKVNEILRQKLTAAG